MVVLASLYKLWVFDITSDVDGFYYLFVFFHRAKMLFKGEQLTYMS